jgi:hypothetical protein
MAFALAKLNMKMSLGIGTVTSSALKKLISDLTYTKIIIMLMMNNFKFIFSQNK